MENKQGGLKENTDKKLSRTGDQLLQLEKEIDRVLEGNGAALKEGIRLLHLQTGIKTAGPHARLLLTLHTAWIGSLQGQSSTGFIGKGMDTIQNGVTSLMTTAVGRYQPGVKELVKTLVSVMGMGIIYLSTEVLGQWKEKFKGYNPLYLKSSGTLFRELGILFITASGLVDAIFSLLMKAADLPEAGRKEFLDLSRLYLLLIVLYASESEKDSKITEMWETLLPYLKSAFPSVEKLAVECADNNMDRSLAGTVRSYLQVLKSALEKDDTQASKRVIEDLLMLFGVSKETLLGDVTLMSEGCHALAQSLGLASSEAEQTMTQIIQST